MPGLKIVLDTGDSERSARQLKKDLSALGSEAAKNEKEFDRLKKRMEDGLKADKAKQSIDKLKKSLNLTRLETARLQAKIGDTTSAFKTLSGGISPAKSALVAATAAMVALGAATVKATTTGMEFEQTMKTVEAVSRATGEEVSALTESAREMGATTEWSASQAAQSLKFLSMAGMNASDSVSSLPGMLDLATAAQTDLATASDIATDTLTAFGMKTEEITRLSDALVNTSIRANTTVTKLGESFKFVAPVASSLGYSIEEASGFLGILANSGIKAEMAGTSLRQSLLRTSKAAKSLGMDINSSLVDVLEEMRNRQYSVNDVTEQFGIIASTGVSILMKNVDVYKKLTKEIEGNENATADLAAKMRDTLRNDFKILGSTIDDALISMYEIFGPNVRSLVKDMTVAVTENKESFDSLGKFISNASFVVAGFVGAASKATKAVSDLWDIFGSIPEGFIDFFSDVADETERAKNEMSGLNDEIGNIAAPELTTLEASIVALEAWGKNIIEFFIFSGKSVGSVLAVLAKGGADVVRMLAEEFLSLGNVVVAALNPWGNVKETFQKEFGSISKASSDFLKSIESNYNVYSDNINSSWESMLSEMVKNTHRASGDIKKELLLVKDGPILDIDGGDSLNIFKEYEQGIRDSLNKTLEYQIRIKQEELDLYKSSGSANVEIVRFAEDEIFKLKQQYADKNKKVFSGQASEVREFYSDYDKATLSSFEAQENELEGSYVKRLKLVENGLISQLELDTQFEASWQKIYDAKVKKEKDQLDKSLENERKASEEIQQIRYNMLKDLGGSAYYDEQINAIENYAQTYIDKLTDILDAEEENTEKRIQLIGDIQTAEAWKNKQIQDLNAETATKDIENREESFANISSNLSSIAALYEEGSKQQEMASAASKVAYAAEMGMMVQKNLMIAVGAVATQGTGGDPYTAFARIAAMTAVMSGILSIANIDFSSGGGGGGGGATQRTGLVSGSGTVLGDESAMSESVSNSMEFLQDVEAEQYSTLVDIYYEMTDLNNNITALSSSVVRGYGDFSAESFGISEGSFAGSLEAISENEKIDDIRRSFTMLIDPGGGILSGFANDLVGSLVGNIFGGGQSRNLIGAGFNIDPYTRGENLLVQSYQDIKVEEEGGWFHSDKSWTETKMQSVNNDISKYFESVLETFSNVSISLANSLGYTTEAAKQYVFDLGKINLMDLEGKEIEEALNNVFSEVADTMTEDLFYEMVKPYQEIDEGMYEAAIRLVSTKAIIEDAFDRLGVSFNVTASEAVKFSQNITDLSGDLEAFQKSIESFYESFYSTFEQQTSFLENAKSLIQSVDVDIEIPKTLWDIGSFYEDVMESLKLKNLTDEFPQTKDAFRDLVSSLDMTTGSGQELFAILMSLTEEADEYYKYLEEIEDFNDTINDILIEGSLSEYGQKLKSLGEWYEDQKATAEDLGISLEKLNDAYSQQIEVLKENFSANINEILVENTLSEYAQGLIDLNAWYKEQVDSAKDLGLSLDDLNKAYGYQLDTLRQNSLSNAVSDATASLSEARDIYTNSLNEEIDRNKTIYDQIQDEIDAKNELISENEDLLESFKSLKDEISDFQTDLVIADESTSPEQRLSFAKAQLDATVMGLYSTDQSEVQDALANLPTVSKEYLDLSQKMNVNEIDQVKALGYVQEILNTSQDIANVQIDKTDETVFGLYAQNAILSENQAYYQTQIDVLESIKSEISGTNDLLDISLSQAEQRYNEAKDSLSDVTSDYEDVSQGGDGIDDQVRRSYETLVKQTFESELGRAGKPAGIDYWVNSLMDDTDSVNLNNFLEAFRNAAVEQGEMSIVGSSTNYESIVKEMYWSKLGRAGLPAGIDYWVNALINQSDSVDLSNFEEAFVNAALAAGEIPAFAGGGTVHGPTLSLIGEGGQSEHITPDSQMQGVKERLDKIYDVLWTILNLSGDKKESIDDLLDIFDRNTMGNLPFKTEAA